MELKGKRILVVDDDRSVVEVLTETLTKLGLSVTNANDGEAAVHRVKAWKPHVVLLDVNMPNESGIDLIPKIRSASMDDYISVVLMSGEQDEAKINLGLQNGADDFMAKPFRSHELHTRIQLVIRLKELQDNLRRTTSRLEEVSLTDDLTGLMNLRALQRKGEEEIQRSLRFKKPVSGLMINIDRFSTVNEISGFVLGSQLLKEVGQEIRSCVRVIDMASRVGADEYFVLLPETDLAGAEFVAERMRDLLEQKEFSLDKQPTRLTVCIGVAGFTKDSQSASLIELFKNAQEALKSAKLAGENRIEMYSFA